MGQAIWQKGYFSQYMDAGVKVKRSVLTVHEDRLSGKKVTSHGTWRQALW